MKYLGYVIMQNGRQDRQVQSEKESSNSGTGVGNGKAKVEGRLEKETVALRQVDLASNKLRSRDLGVEQKREDRETAGKISEVGARS